MKQPLPDLPVMEIVTALRVELGKGHAVVSAPPGSGKTTLLPPALLDEPWLAGQRMLLLEPRRLAARAAAMRISELLGDKCGSLAGYRTRYDSCVSAATRIEVITEGILVRRLQNEPDLPGVALIIFDEFHERSLLADLGLALALDLCQLRPELRLLVMSATLDTGAVSALLGQAPVLESGGRQYPVAISHLPPLPRHRRLAEQVARGVLTAWQEQQGDILAFLPGAGEIHQCRALLRGQLPSALVLPLYGNLSPTEQDRVFHRDSPQRRVILASPVAETSITLQGISTVVDSGWCRRPVFSATSGLTQLRLTRIARDSAAQRAGRAGRLGPGHCYQLWSKEEDFSLLARTPAAILQADLSPLALELALWGVTDPLQLRWLDPPRQPAWDSASGLLQRLRLLDASGHVTATGKQAAALPVHPRLAAMLLAGRNAGLAGTAALLAAYLEERTVPGAADSVDLVEQLQRAATLVTEKKPEPADRYYRQHLQQQTSQLLQILKVRRAEPLQNAAVGWLLAHAYPERIAQLRSGSRTRYQLASGKGAQLPEHAPLAGSALLVVAHLDNRSGDGRIFLAAPLSEEEVQRHHPQLLCWQDRLEWDDEEQRVVSSRDLLLESLTLRSLPARPPDDGQLLAAFLEGVRRNFTALPWHRETRELQTRLRCLASWQNGQWPDWSDAALSKDLQWLAPFCLRMTSLQQTHRLNLAEALLATLSWRQQQQLEELAPSHLLVPSGSRIRLQYAIGKAPALAVRLQEVFGLMETPRLCAGTVPVVMHLLSPAGRPMQITEDLGSFWHAVYPEVRKELAGRYPRHHWPTDPFSVTATSKSKKAQDRLAAAAKKKP